MICQFTEIFKGLKEGLLYNDTKSNRIVYHNLNNNKKYYYNIKKYKAKELLMSNIPKDHARPAFARGLCYRNNVIIGGSSPATISVYLSNNKNAIKTINLSLDVRIAIHGLEIWPY